MMEERALAMAAWADCVVHWGWTVEVAREDVDAGEGSEDEERRSDASASP